MTKLKLEPTAPTIKVEVEILQQTTAITDVEPAVKEEQPPKATPRRQFVVRPMFLLALTLVFTPFALLFTVFEGEQAKDAPAPASGQGDQLLMETQVSQQESVGLNPNAQYPFFPLVCNTPIEERGPYGDVVSGSLRNYSNETITFIEVHIGVYDRMDNLIRKITDSRSNLGPWETWEFRARGPSASKNEHYVLDDITFF